MTLLEILMNVKGISFLRLAKITRLRTMRLHEIVDGISPMTRSEMKRLTKALGVSFDLPLKKNTTQGGSK
jgi:plasmid maintenance system antidote protein VapI